MADRLSDLPTRDRWLDDDGRLSRPWLRWFVPLLAAVNASPGRVERSTRLSAQSGSVLATALALPVLPEGLYRVSAFLRETTGSGATVSVGFTLNGVAGTASVPRNGAVLVQIDAGSVLTYAIDAAGMVYDAAIVVERVE